MERTSKSMKSGPGIGKIGKNEGYPMGGNKRLAHKMELQIPYGIWAQVSEANHLRRMENRDGEESMGVVRL